ncbi:BaiN/RdsA family NAD(P)/FAD-dependent oxidoreductase [Aliidiomarina indica]|uniref:NAD(P)/FAD-dependent oxidoreductase n=1 Tax=Aliidiomarina indica TaxID=2749147 RepID=UPI00188DC78C|nr:NAD(P)/FAD-dependent oxidoreductase [Aliidiomarina indica]
MSTSETPYDVIIIGAGAAGLMSGISAGQRGKRVLILDHAKQAGKKILISGGGRCNFTNMFASPDHFLSQNPHFCKSALSRYTQWDFLSMVDKHQIPWHEKTLGQLFCDDSAKDIVNMLMQECKDVGTKVQLRTDVLSVRYQGQYHVDTSQGTYVTDNLVVACGGLSMPKLGASPLGYELAKQFGHSIVPVRAGLVPFTLHDHDKAAFADLTGIATDVIAAANQTQFKEAMLFTHRGLSGPAMLQISSYWQAGDAIAIDLLPGDSVGERLRDLRREQPKLSLPNALSRYLPKRLVQALMARQQWPQSNLADLSNQAIDSIDRDIHTWVMKPNGTEGYRTAEVTLGGVNVNEVSSKTMESLKQPGLYFIGEVLDVTGWLGGYNFQWAWSSGWVAGQSV